MLMVSDKLRTGVRNEGRDISNERIEKEIRIGVTVALPIPRALILFLIPPVIPFLQALIPV